MPRDHETSTLLPKSRDNQQTDDIWTASLQNDVTDDDRRVTTAIDDVINTSGVPGEKNATEECVAVETAQSANVGCSKELTRFLSTGSNSYSQPVDAILNPHVCTIISRVQFIYVHYSWIQMGPIFAYRELIRVSVVKYSSSWIHHGGSNSSNVDTSIIGGRQ